MNRELPDVQAGFRKGRKTRDQIANICWIIGKARQFQKNIYFCFIDYAKAFDCVDHNKQWKILKEMGIPDHLKKVGKTARPFSYDLNQIPCDYAVEVRNRFKGLDLIDRVPDELRNEVHDTVQETGIKTIPMEKK